MRPHSPLIGKKSMMTPLSWFHWKNNARFKSLIVFRSVILVCSIVVIILVAGKKK
jgi:hypothetical protein